MGTQGHAGKTRQQAPNSQRSKLLPAEPNGTTRACLALPAQQLVLQPPEPNGRAQSLPPAAPGTATNPTLARATREQSPPPRSGLPENRGHLRRELGWRLPSAVQLPQEKPAGFPRLAAPAASLPQARSARAAALPAVGARSLMMTLPRHSSDSAGARDH